MLKTLIMNLVSDKFETISVVPHVGTENKNSVSKIFDVIKIEEHMSHILKTQQNSPDYNNKFQQHNN